MPASENAKTFKQGTAQLREALSDIRRKMEGLVAENQRLREVVRLAESELRSRRDQVQRLEASLHSQQNNRLEVRARVEHAVEKIDELIANTEKAHS